MRSRCRGTRLPEASRAVAASSLSFARSSPVDERIAHAGAYPTARTTRLPTADVRMPGRRRPAGCGQRARSSPRIADQSVRGRRAHRRSTPAASSARGSALSRYPLVADIDAATDVTCLFDPAPVALRACSISPELIRIQGSVRSRLTEHPARALAALRASSRTPARPIIADADQPRGTGRLRLRKGDVVEGEPCDAFYLVRGGYVAATRAQRRRRCHADLPARWRLGRRSGAVVERTVAVFADGRRARRLVRIAQDDSAAAAA